MAWNAGYMTDIEYTYGYYPELNPIRAVAAIRNAGQQAPVVRNACELGFGQGLSILVHAAAQPGVNWWGTDFNPAQADFARELAARSGSGARLFDQSFEEFCSRDDLPEFEFIALHGIWTWINDENRRIIVDFVRRKLAVGGVLYLSYNTLPGWAAPSPIRHILKQHDRSLGAPGTPVKDRLDRALDFLDELIGTNPSYTRGYQLVADRVKETRKLDRNYLAHEYLNEHWEPMYFSQMASWLDDAKVSYICSSNILEHQDAANFTPDQSAMLARQTDQIMRETVRDFMVAQQFRKDLWIKGPRPFTTLEHVEDLRQQRYILAKRRADIALTASGMQGEFTLQEAVYDPLLDAMADQQIKTFAALESVGAAHGLSLGQVNSAVGVLLGIGAMSPVQDDKAIAKARPHTDNLNKDILERALSGATIGFLASPVTGGAIALDRIDQLMLRARTRGKKTAAEWADEVFAIFTAQGQQIVKNGQQLTTPEENLTELRQQAANFHEKYLPILIALGIA